ncbi:hypothetical protein PS15p_201881 [Mucor circinelloides]
MMDQTSNLYISKRFKWQSWKYFNLFYGSKMFKPSKSIAIFLIAFLVTMIQVSAAPVERPVNSAVETSDVEEASFDSLYDMYKPLYDQYYTRLASTSLIARSHEDGDHNGCDDGDDSCNGRDDDHNGCDDDSDSCNGRDDENTEHESTSASSATVIYPPFPPFPPPPTFPPFPPPPVFPPFPPFS